MTLTSPLLSAVSGDLHVLQVTYSTVLKLETKRAKIIRQAPKLWGQHTDVLPQNGLKLLLLEATLDDEASAAVDGTIGTQLGEQVSCDVLFGPLHALADLLDIGEDSFLRHVVSKVAHEGFTNLLMGNATPLPVYGERCVLTLFPSRRHWGGGIL